MAYHLMDMIAHILTLIAWGGVGLLLLLLYRIAYFYQVTSGQLSHYRLFLIPLALLVLGGLRYALAGDVDLIDVDLIGDGLQLIGGIALILLGISLLQMMTGGRK